MSGPPALSVVVPTLNEARRLPRLLEGLEALGDEVEVLVVDGGSTDGTEAVARRAGARVVAAPRGRGRQLRAGAEAARGRWLLFLHADCRLTPQAARAVRDFMARAPDDAAAHFSFALDARGWWWRALEWGQRIRERVAGLVYGDQGLLIPAALYRRAGGHPEWPLMEDVEVVDRVRAAGSLVRLGPPLPTSPRRYRREGPVRGWLRNAFLVTLHRLGVAPEWLLRWYGPEPGDAPTRTLLVFAKAPRPGTVKTRLAADLGEARATRIYRTLGSTVVDALRGGPWRTVVCYAPAGAREEMEGWLGTERVAYRAQSPGDLGARMARGVEEAFDDGAREVCVVGTDAPGVDRALVERAFSALAHADVVLGPAEDGGYWLVALRRPFPELFRGIPWSTSEVLERTLERARALELETTLLPTLRDVDRADDVPAELLKES